MCHVNGTMRLCLVQCWASCRLIDCNSKNEMGHHPKRLQQIFRTQCALSLPCRCQLIGVRS